MAVSYTNFYSEDVLKIFPVSFERASKYDRVLSEENLVDWFRSVASDSSDLEKNSRYSYVITDKLHPNFAQNAAATNQIFEFMIGGYYVKLSDRGFANMLNLNQKDVYAVIEESDGDFRHLIDGEDINSDNDTLRALKFVAVDSGAEFTSSNPRLYKLHILTVNNGYSIPAESKRSSFAVDGGEID
jgi:hypothetical protein